MNEISGGGEEEDGCEGSADQDCQEGERKDSDDENMKMSTSTTTTAAMMFKKQMQQYAFLSR